MSTVNVDYNAVEGNLKDIFAGYENAIPKEYVIMREFPFDSSNMVGDEYQHGVELTRPHGFTTAAYGVFPALNVPVARTALKARLQPYQMYLRERVTYDILSRAQSSKQAARNELGATIESMRDAQIFRQETLGFYGQSGLAAVGTVTVDACSVTSATWAAGMWAGNEGMPVDVRDSTGATLYGTVHLGLVDFDNLTLNFGSGEGSLLVAGRTLWFQGGSTTTELVGIKKVLNNAGTLYNISAALYGLWKGIVQPIAAGSDATFKQCIQLDAKIRARGGAGDQLGFVNPDVFTTLVSTMEAARTFSGPDQYRPTEVVRGTQELAFYSPVGKTTIKPHPIVQRGDYFSLRADKWKRAGATDPTFSIPGSSGNLSQELQDYPGREIRAMSNNTWFSPRPAASGQLSGIVYGGTTTS